jgi:hypothetical protein
MKRAKFFSHLAEIKFPGSLDRTVGVLHWTRNPAQPTSKPSLYPSMFIYMPEGTLMAASTKKTPIFNPKVIDYLCHMVQISAGIEANGNP